LGHEWMSARRQFLITKRRGCGLACIQFDGNRAEVTIALLIK
jgi:hypothetical protein